MQKLKQCLTNTSKNTFTLSFDSWTTDRKTVNMSAQSIFEAPSWHPLSFQPIFQMPHIKHYSVQHLHSKQIILQVLITCIVGIIL